MGRSDPPRELGGYELLGLLATGGMAEVFLARKRGAPPEAGTVVVKRVLPHLARQKAFHDMFLDEARIVSRIAHPNVVAMRELCEAPGDGADDELFLVMEHLEGESLSTLLRQLRKTGTLAPIDVAIHIAMAAAAGLHAAHELKNEAGKSLDIVHRDVSPQNLFVLYSGAVKVIDFGIAKAAERQAGHTQTGHVKGKFAYMPPEQIGAGSVDRRVDVFALGVVLHELLTGQKLFERDHDLLVLKAICEDPIPPPSAKRPEVPPEVDAVVMTALARVREKRFPSAEAMRAALEASLGSLPRPETPPDRRLSDLMRTLFADRIARQQELVGRGASAPSSGVVIPAPRASSPHSDPSLSNPLPRTPPAMPAPASSDATSLESSPPSHVERSDVGQAISIAGAAPIGGAPKRGRWIAIGASAAALAALGVVLATRGSSATDGGVASAPASPPPSASTTTVATPPAQPATSVAPAAVSASASTAAPSTTASTAASAPARPTQIAGPPTNATPPPVVPKPTAKPTSAPTGFTRFE
ncbi:MAG: protein kinase [Polyangiaceae bacterium]